MPATGHAFACMYSLLPCADGLLSLQVGGHKETLKTATAAPALPPQDNRFVAANDNFLRGQQETQQLIMRCAFGLLC